MDLETFEKIEAVNLLIDDNDLALIENSVVLKHIDRMIRVVKYNISNTSDHELTLERLEKLSQGLNHRNLVEMELFREILNRKFFFTKLKELTNGG